MLKDIFIDTDVIPKLSNPLDYEYKRFIKWLLNYDRNNNLNNAYLVVSSGLLGEYSRSLRNSHLSSNNFCVIIDMFSRQGRFHSITNRRIKAFKQKFFKKHVLRRLTSSKNDRDHIPVVMLSDRKYALSLDANFRRDINNFPRFSARAAKRPQDIPYDR